MVRCLRGVAAPRQGASCLKSGPRTGLGTGGQRIGSLRSPAAVKNAPGNGCRVVRTVRQAWRPQERGKGGRDATRERWKRMRAGRLCRGSGTGCAGKCNSGWRGLADTRQLLMSNANPPAGVPADVIRVCLPLFRWTGGKPQGHLSGPNGGTQAHVFPPTIRLARLSRYP